MSILRDKFQTIIQIFMTYGMNFMPLQITPSPFLEFPAIITANIVVGQNSNVEGHCHYRMMQGLDILIFMW